MLTRLLKIKFVKTNSKKNTTPNTIHEIKTGIQTKILILMEITVTIWAAITYLIW